MAVDDMAADTADFATAEESAGSVAFDGDDSAGPTEGVDFSGTNVQNSVSTRPTSSRPTVNGSMCSPPTGSP